MYEGLSFLHLAFWNSASTSPFTFGIFTTGMFTSDFFLPVSSSGILTFYRSYFINIPFQCLIKLFDMNIILLMPNVWWRGSSHQGGREGRLPSIIMNALH